jgi:hypothetical protein
MIKRSEGWLAARVGDQLVMMNVEREVYIGLNAVGAFVWEMLETPKDVAELCSGVASEFDTTAQACRDDVAKFLSALETNKAIERVSLP